jgi:hypothetical protein
LQQIKAIHNSKQIQGNDDRADDDKTDDEIEQLESQIKMLNPQ